LRHSDRECRWGQEHGIWLLRTTRSWLKRDFEVLRPIFERMRVEGPDYLRKNASLAEEVRRTFVDLDQIEKELTKAGQSITKAKDATASYHVRLAALCETPLMGRKQPGKSNGEAVRVRIDAGD
jgi:hypothetical protein